MVCHFLGRLERQISVFIQVCFKTMSIIDSLKNCKIVLDDKKNLHFTITKIVKIH